MTVTTLALRGLRHYWRTNLATALGLATAVGVLAGASTVGASVRQSLRDLALSRIGNTQFAVVSNSFFRESLAPGAPMIAVEAVVTHDDSGRRASGVSVYAVDERFWKFHERPVSPPAGDDVLLSPALARELGSNPGDAVLVRVPRISMVPTESLHGSKDDPGRTFRTQMKFVLSREEMGEFSLRPAQSDVRAVFLPLHRLQREFDLGGRVNTLLLGANPDLAGRYSLEDAGLRLRNGKIEHQALVLDDYLVERILAVDPDARPVFTYLANTIASNGREIPYSLVAAMDRPDLPDDNSIVLTDWAARDLQARPGDSVELTYYLWDPSGRLRTESASFRVTGVIPIQPEHRDLAPEYPGISGAETVADWDPPFPIELKRIRPQDEEYWHRHRATPKAYISLAAGQKLWRSRYGAVTSVQLSPQFDADRLRAAIDPERAGLNVIDVREQAAAASRGTTDFGEYFLYFSFFLIVSALLLTVLFFRFGLEQRSAEISTLRALGFGGGALRRLFLTEGFVLAIAGGLLGILGALLWSGLILLGLRTWWIDAVGTEELALHFSPAAALQAVAAALIVGPLVILFGLRTLMRQAPRSSAPDTRRMPVVAMVALAAGIGLTFAGGAGGFFGAGALLLTSSVLFLYWWLRGAPGAIRNVPGLGIRYTAHRPGRSVLCVALIASATFLVVAIDAFRRDVREEGPWRYFAESSIPIYNDPNLQSEPGGKWLSFRLRPGDDASCLNLYSPRNPRVLGVPSAYMQLPPSTDDTIAAAVDANTLQYVLHRSLGDVIEVGGARLRIVRALPDSVFQSEILISDSDFQRAFPEEGGYRVFLIDAPAGAEAGFESAFADYGLDVTTTADRRAAYHRVENTYLSTFQALGGLGLVLGTIGLAAVLMRNVLERRRELAMLRAVGYQPAHLSRMTFSENLFLLTAGLAIGAVCAMLAVLPTVMARGGSPPILSTAALLAAVLLTGLAASLAAVRFMNRAPVIEALRSE